MTDLFDKQQQEKRLVNSLRLHFKRENPSCLTCENIDIENNICKKYGSQPPLRIIVAGCAAYDPEIPFQLYRKFNLNNLEII